MSSFEIQIVWFSNIIKITSSIQFTCVWMLQYIEALLFAIAILMDGTKIENKGKVMLLNIAVTYYIKGNTGYFKYLP